MKKGLKTKSIPRIEIQSATKGPLKIYFNQDLKNIALTYLKEEEHGYFKSFDVLKSFEIHYVKTYYTDVPEWDWSLYMCNLSFQGLQVTTYLLVRGYEEEY